ncbi:MAG TPA: inner membrane CreD family protein [Blastocatellia bacterium]|nr:inner membrane CreD family protein [Blastocatellia bacterium]
MAIGVRLFFIGAIFVCACVAWAVLGSTIFARTYESDSLLKERVESNWGAEHKQEPPAAICRKKVPRKVETVEGGKKIVRTEEEIVTTVLPLESSNIEVRIALQPRQKGLLWYSTYAVTFEGNYLFRNTSDQDTVEFAIKYPSARAIYDDLTLSVGDQPLMLASEDKSVKALAKINPGSMATLKLAYRSQGMNRWGYGFGGDVAQVRGFNLRMLTDFKEIDFPENTLSPSEKHESATGWQLAWSYKNMVSGIDIAIAMPEKQQPGPLAGRISYFAPVSLLFFFVVIFVLTAIRGVDLHPVNYAFLAAAFFSFHLLLAYVVDHVSILAAFALSSAVSVLLVVTYLRLVVGWRFALREAALSQVIYLVMFSYAFLLKGFTGLAVTIVAIVTLFVVMQLTGRMRWNDMLTGRPRTGTA